MKKIKKSQKNTKIALNDLKYVVKHNICHTIFSNSTNFHTSNLCVFVMYLPFPTFISISDAVFIFILFESVLSTSFLTSFYLYWRSRRCFCQYFI